jgi:hypothetical protein
MVLCVFWSNAPQPEGQGARTNLAVLSPLSVRQAAEVQEQRRHLRDAGR